MVCSGEKTKLIIIGTNDLKKNIFETIKETGIEVIVANKLVKPTESEKLLGLIVSNNLSWKNYLYGET